MKDFGFKKKEVLAKLDEIDIKNVFQYGFAKERYPYSLGETYEYFSQKNGEKVDFDLKKKLFPLKSLFSRVFIVLL